MNTPPTLLITLDTSECCASGMCASLAPTAFEIDQNGYAVVLDGAADTDPETLAKAARSCPTLCIALHCDGEEIDLFA